LIARSAPNAKKATDGDDEDLIKAPRQAADIRAKDPPAPFGSAAISLIALELAGGCHRDPSKMDRFSVGCTGWLNRLSPSLGFYLGRKSLEIVKRSPQCLPPGQESA
jgi:hypothetical protein